MFEPVEKKPSIIAEDIKELVEGIKNDSISLGKLEAYQECLEIVKSWEPVAKDTSYRILQSIAADIQALTSLIENALPRKEKRGNETVDATSRDLSSGL